VLVAFAACAFPDFEFEDETNSSTETKGAGASTTTASVGGASGCTLGEIGSCGAEQKCTVDPTSGAVICGMAGSRQVWDLCSTDADCADGSWCDVRFEVCKPFCDNVDDCNFGDTQGECVPLTDAQGAVIAGVGKHCTSGCEPKTAAPCVTPAVTCVLDQQRFDCAKSGGTTIWQSCTVGRDCVPGLACGDDGSGSLCRPWCTPPGDLPECPAPFNYCAPTDPQVFWQAAEYGFCL
jgi:hypothetical protein